MRYMYKQLERDYEHQNSLEWFKEYCLDNELWFTRGGYE